MAESRVRVGVRIRPLLSKEKGQNVTFSAYDAQSVSFKAQTYTYDHVFGMELSQSQLYEQTAEPMLKSFLEGYNCTIMAYGQTGSGKTYSMGTSDITYQDTENQGLISRFVADLFANLNVSKAEGEHLSFAVKASYLEIYGEEVFDLLHSDSASPQRLPLQVREDEGGKIFVQGQNEFEVEDAEATLEMLSAGARHRITACTAMNAGSSRSHAVFTLQLEQRIRSRTAGAEGEEDVQTLRSKLTFVDLAGSERIKRTGAEGQRLKEGIQINSGLFNLGQVINSLADEQKLKNGVKNNHVPYRNSKLTHLLKDALGGNSQTLFLACVSPAESNESETQSTLQYAKQARNIQNKPVQNVDKVQRELQRLRMAVKAWTCRAVTSMFGNKAPDSEEPDAETMEQEAAELMMRPEVANFVQGVNAGVTDAVEGAAPTARNGRISMGTMLSPSTAKGVAAARRTALCSPLRGPRSRSHSQMGMHSPPCKFPGLNGAYIAADGLMSAYPPAHGLAEEHDETGEELIAQILEIHNKEKEKMLKEGSAGMGAVEEGEEEGSPHAKPHLLPDEVQQMDESIREKEELLLKLKSTVEGFAVMRSDYNTLLGAINSLEEEKKELEAELARAKREPASKESGGNLDALLKRKNERIQKVDQELKQMREDKKTKDNLFNQMKRDAKKCEMLEKDLEKLKGSRVTMAKQQKTQAVQINRLKKDQAIKNVLFKKSDVKKQQQVNQLKSELATKTRILEHKVKECSSLKTKFEACQEYIRTEAKVGRLAARSGGGAVAAGKGPKATSLTALEAQQLHSSKSMLEHMLVDRLDRHISKLFYDQRAAHLLNLNADMEQDAAELDELMVEKRALVADLRKRAVLPAVDLELAAAMASDGEDVGEALDEDTDLTPLCGAENNGLSEEEKYSISQLRTSIDMCESSLERLTKEVDVCNADIDELSLRLEDHGKGKGKPDSDPDSEWYSTGKKIVGKLSQAQSQNLLWGLMEEKLQTLEQLRITHSALSRSQYDQEQQAEKQQELQDWVDALRDELKTRLERAEKQRVMDVWALMQNSNSSGSSSPKNPTSEQAAAGAAREDAASRIAYLRALELEKELRISIAREESSEVELRDKDLLLREMQQRISEMSLRAEFGEGGSGDEVWTEVEGDRRDSQPIQALGAQCPDGYLDKLFQVWGRLGLNEEQRAETLECVQKARQLAKERAVLDADAQLQCARREVGVVQDRLSLLCSAVGCPISKYVHVAEVAESGEKEEEPLLPLLASLQYGCSTAEADVALQLPALVAVKDHLTEVMSEMWLEITDLSPALRALAKLTLPVGAEEESPALRAARQLVVLKATLQTLPVWEGEIRKLNRTRVQLTSKLVVARDGSAKLLGELQLRDVKGQLTALINASSFTPEGEGEGEDQLSAQAVQMAVQILQTNSASNPPGSEKLLVAMERVQLVLESVKANRSAAAQQVARFVDLYLQNFPGEEDQLARAVGGDSVTAVQLTAQRELLLSASEGRAWSSPSLDALFALAAAVRTLAPALNDSLRSQLSAVLHEINSSCGADEGNKLVAGFLRAQEGAAGVVEAMGEVAAELDGMTMFLEEQWLQVKAQGLADSWAAAAGPHHIRLTVILQENASLLEEQQRIQGVVDAQRELLRADEALCAQVAESREFERQSAENRGKKLKGGGTTLLEEERFRKNSKAKFNKLSERMMLHLGKLNALTGKAEGRAAHLDVRPDLSALSEQGKDLTRGRFRDKVDLMHLQLPTGTIPSMTPSSIPVPPGKQPLSSRAPPPALEASALAGSGAGGLGLGLGGVKSRTVPEPKRPSTLAHPPTPQNVFGFAADSFDAQRSSSGSASPSFGFEGATEKENLHNQQSVASVSSDTFKPAQVSQAPQSS